MHGWNKNPFGAGTEEAYKNIPFFMSTRGYGVFVNTTYPITYHVASRSLAAVNLTVEHSVLDLFIIYGPSMKEILARYASITGWPALPPLESFGIWHTPQQWVGKTARKICSISPSSSGSGTSRWTTSWRSRSARAVSRTAQNGRERL